MKNVDDFAGSLALIVGLGGHNDRDRIMSTSITFVVPLGRELTDPWCYAPVMVNGSIVSGWM